MIFWQFKTFSDLSSNELYDLLKLRVDVFIVEQNCPYPDLDNVDRDPRVLHLLGYDSEVLVAYARILPKGSYCSMLSFGRIAVAKGLRSTGLGKELVTQVIEYCREKWADELVKISAQLYLENFYTSFGFIRSSDEYLEDGIPHIAMQNHVRNLTLYISR